MARRVSFQRYLRMVGGSILVIMLSLALGCGASRQEVAKNEEPIDLDALLGEDEMTESNRDSDEAEVLKLLGITPAEQAADPEVMRPVPATVETPVELTDIDVIDDLRKDLDTKDDEISNLRSELADKKARLSKLDLNKNQMPSQGHSGTLKHPSVEFSRDYKEALSVFQDRQYQTALTEFQRLLQSDANNSLSDNCQYWVGECYYGMMNYNQAIVEFNKVFAFTDSNKSDDAQLKLGLCYIQLGDKAQARSELERVLTGYPKSEYTAKAKNYLNKL